MANRTVSRQDTRDMDPSLVQLCREMTPAQRLAAAVGLSEAAFQFHLAGTEYRKTLQRSPQKDQAQ